MTEEYKERKKLMKKRSIIIHELAPFPTNSSFRGIFTVPNFPPYI